MYADQDSRLTPARRYGTQFSLAILSVVAFAIFGSMWFPNGMATVLQALSGQTLLKDAYDFLKDIYLAIAQFSPFILVYLSIWVGTIIGLALALPVSLAAKDTLWLKSWLGPVMLFASCLSLLLFPVPTFVALWMSLYVRRQQPVNRETQELDVTQLDRGRWR